MVLKERTDFSQFHIWEALVVLTELIFHNFYVGRIWWPWTDFLWFWPWEDVVVLTELILNSSTLGGCGGFERLDFLQFLLWEGVIVLKELIFYTFSFGSMWCSWNNWFLTVSHLGGCGGLESTDFKQFLLWEGVVVLKELILNIHLSSCQLHPSKFHSWPWNASSGRYIWTKVNWTWLRTGLAHHIPLLCMCFGSKESFLP